MNPLVAPQFYPGDFAIIQRDVEMINKNKQTGFILDLMDGMFVQMFIWISVIKQ
ncbi:MAG: hypothetical protein IPH89_13605 [Bacteroidetes bacterium]|nr:hypothetical protein [Bacteroidota bacterium]